MAIKGVLFDLDGTLWGMGPDVDRYDWSEITALQATVLRPYFADWDVPCDPVEVISAFFENLNHALRPPTSDLSEPRWHPVVRRTVAAFGGELDDAMADVFLDVLNDVPFHHFGVRPFPDSAPALEALAERGLKLGAVTNNPKKASRLIREARDQGLPDVLEVMVTSVDCGWRKPHHVPFQLALDALGIAAHEAMFVGDSWENDIAPALSLGMTAVLRSPSASDGGAGGRHHTVTSLLELLPILEAANPAPPTSVANRLTANG